MQTIKIDFDNPGLPQRLDVVENDAQSRFFKAVLYKDGKAYVAPSGATYSIMYRGFGPQNEGWYDTINDGAGKRAACSVSGNIVTCEIARQALRVPGHVSVVLCVTGSNGYMLHGWPIDCNCRNDNYTGGTSVESFFYITQITNADWTSAIQTWEELKNMIDPTLSLSGKAADAAKVGQTIGITNLDPIDISLDKGITIDSTSGYKKAATDPSGRSCSHDYIDMLNISYIQIIAKNSSDAYSKSYMTYEYDANHNYLGATRELPNQFYPLRQNQDKFYPYDGKTFTSCKYKSTRYVQIVFFTADEYVAKAYYYSDEYRFGPKANIAYETIQKMNGYQNEFLRIAYSDIFLAPINTEEHFLTAAHLGFNALKCDCRLTKDNKIILCHDDGFTTNSDGKIIEYDKKNNTKIRTLTESQCTELKFETSYYDMDHNASPCTLADFLTICKEKDKIPFITLRDEYVEETVPVIFEELNKYNLRMKAIINSMTFSSLEWVRKYDENIQLNYVLNLGAILTNKIVDKCADLGRCSVSLFTVPADTDGTIYDNCKPSVIHAQKIGVPVQNAQIVTTAQYNQFLSDGFTGLQIIRAIFEYAKENFIFSVNVSDGAAIITGWYKWTTPFTADISVSENMIEVKEIKRSGSKRKFADGVMSLWMNIMPYELSAKSKSGKPINILWENNKVKITGESMNENNTYYIKISI